MELLSVEEMRALEHMADTRGLSYAQMMHNAGRGAAQAVRARIQAHSRVLILVGPGNNGGDGLVCAVALAQFGSDTRCWLLKPRTTDDPVFAAAQAAGIDLATADLDVLRDWLSDATVIVDALLGTGVSRPIDGALRDVLLEVQVSRGAGERMDRNARSPAPPHRRAPALFALDGPTGMNYDTGALDPATVPADVTITFHGPKRGHYCHPAAEARGELVVVPIGVERLEIGDWRVATNRQSPISNLQLLDDALARTMLPSRKLDSNKGSHGKALVVGGCADYIGAPTLTARAAYRVGAGLVAYAVPEAIKGATALLCPEATFVPLSESHDAHAPASLPRIERWLGRATDGAAVALGPGMGQADASRDFLLALVQAARDARFTLRGLVCDADALNMLASQPDWHERLPPTTVLTPHAGEMGRLADLSIVEIQSDRIGHALQFAQTWGHVVLLKGAYTVIAAPDGRGAVLPFANSAMATAGTGDVLTGCIVGWMAQGLTPFDAAVCGGYLHGLAGERWRAKHGDAGLLASDLLPLLPDVIRDLKQ